MKFPRTKKIAFCNNKGGVGKTTLAFNCAAGFADRGYKTVLVDLDPQCNSTIQALGLNFYESNLFATQTIYAVIRGIMEGGADIDLGVQFLPSPHTKNLFVMPGDLRLSSLEDVLGTAFPQAMAGNRLGYFQTSAIYRFLLEKGMTEQVDIFVIDTSPSLSTINRAIVLGSDYFVVPMRPDSFSMQGIENLGNALERWKRDWKNTAVAVAADTPARNVLPGDPVFIGYILNSYNVYGEKPIKEHRNWMEQIPEKIRDNLSRKHSKNGLVETSWPHPLAVIQDHGQLPATSQKSGIAIFDIDPADIRSHEQGALDNLEKSKIEFGALMDKLVNLLSALG